MAAAGRSGGLRGRGRRSVGPGEGPGRPAAQEDHEGPEGEHREPPPEVDVDAERPAVEGAIADQAVGDEQAADDGKQQSDRDADVERHWSPSPHRKRKLRNKATASTKRPSASGRWYHGRCPSFGNSVSE